MKCVIRLCLVDWEIRLQLIYYWMQIINKCYYLFPHKSMENHKNKLYNHLTVVYWQIYLTFIFHMCIYIKEIWHFHQWKQYLFNRNMVDLQSSQFTMGRCHVKPWPSQMAHNSKRNETSDKEDYITNRDGNSVRFREEKKGDISKPFHHQSSYKLRFYSSIQIKTPLKSPSNKNHS